MTIKIEIIDPRMSSAIELRALSAFLLACAEDSTVVSVKNSTTKKVGETSVPAETTRTLATHDSVSPGDVHFTGHSMLTPADNPATGAPTEIDNDLAAAAKAFAPNVQAGAPSSAGAGQSSTVPAAPTSTLTAPVLAPLPPVPTGAGSATTAAPPIPLGPLVQNADLDKDGLPWDARIHSGGRAQIASGHWKKKRGVEPEEVARVEAELRQLMAIPTPPAAGAAAWTFKTAEELGITTPNVPPVPPAVIAEVPPPPVPPVPSATSATPASPISFPALVTRITSAKTQGRLTDAQIQEILVFVGVPALPLLVARQDLIPAVSMKLDEILGA